MGIFSWIVVGLIAGMLAKWIMPGDQKAGFFMTMGLGIVGGLVGGFVMSLITGEGVTGFNLYTLLVATLGAVIVLLVYGFARKSLKK
ncbi:MAG: GlsB/YeaQ/YmgE family stress response membrane protein [Coriobacteriia bacterium]|nr:GlsB/YeaQ/YmgE family stress response membrane protein [Coriobacteriia bacterium]